MADLPDGISLASSFWGEPKSDTSLATAHGTAVGSVQPVPYGLPYAGRPVQDRSKKCVANDDTCNGWRISGSDLCAGHAGVMRPHEADE